MKNKNNTIMLIMIITISMVLLTWNKSYSYKMNNITPEEKEIERKEFGIYLQENGTTYKETNTFPDTGYLLNTSKTECHEYGNDNVIQNAVEQSLTNGVIDGSIIVTSQKSMYCKIYFDKESTIPTVSTFGITGKDKAGNNLTNGYTYNKTVTYTFTWTDEDVAQYCLSTNNASCNGTWTLTNGAKTITISNATYTGTEGLKTIYVYLKDKANNISSTTTKSTAKITVDQTPPVVNTLTLTGNKTGTFTLTAGYSHTTKVNYTSTITETNMEGYCVVDGSSCSNYNTLPTKSLNSTITIGATQGSHSITVSVKDKAGNVESKTQSITLDTQNPTISLTQGTVTETNITVTVNASDSNGIASVTCTAVGNNETKTGTYNSTAKTCTFSGLKDNTTYSITGVATDGSGRKTTSTTIDVTTIKSLTAGQKKAQETLKVVPRGISDRVLGDMYRFVGTADDVDNWICFGYTNAETDCNSPSSDSMYRIIGITENGQLKLIKNSPYDNFSFFPLGQTSRNNAWNHSKVYSELNCAPGGLYFGGGDKELEDCFISNYINSAWSNLILIHSWPASIDFFDNSPWYDANGIFAFENPPYTNNKAIVNPVSAKVALMYLADYYYSCSFDYQLGVYASYQSARCKEGWLHLSQNRNEKDSISEEFVMGFERLECQGYSIAQDGSLYTDTYDGNIYTKFVRPSFYINSNVISSGNGTLTSPFIVSKPS